MFFVVWRSKRALRSGANSPGSHWDKHGIRMSRFDTNRCVELLATSANDHTRGELRMSEMRWRLMATPTQTYWLTMWLLRPTSFAFPNASLCWSIIADVWRNDKPIEVWLRASSNHFTFFSVMYYEVVVLGTFLKNAMDFSMDNAFESLLRQKNSCATMSSTIFESTRNLRISPFVRMKHSIETDFIVSKNSIFSSLLAYLYFSHSTGCWLLLCFS